MTIHSKIGLYRPIHSTRQARASLVDGMSRQAAAIVSQTPKEFDLPGIPWPPQFHYAGPFFDDAGREPIPFRWEKLDGRPLIYASLGTLVNGMAIIYQTILAAVGRALHYTRRTQHGD
ncbi:MAG TPA: hypothetical protein VN828_00290 [Acidobacteriaceae bacterium]|jgi:UDP:flavonoid glycosyltransferase YjiC (YdhE family)|nr:hypothetical protein [Acidobacteriaceae bacterium]